MSKSKYYKHPRFGMVYGNDTLTPVGTLVWPALTKPKDPPPPKPGEEPGRPRHEVTILFDKEEETVAFFKEALEAVKDDMVEYYNEGKGVTIAVGAVLIDGDSGKIDLEKYPYYAGKWGMVIRNAQLPKFVDRDKNVELEARDFEGGMKVRANFQPMVTAHGFSYKLKALQRWEDTGERFGGGMRDDLSIFDDCEDAQDAPIKEQYVDDVGTEEVVEATPAAPTPPAKKAAVASAGKAAPAANKAPAAPAAKAAASEKKTGKAALVDLL